MLSSVRKNTVIVIEMDFKYKKQTLAILNNLETKGLGIQNGRAPAMQEIVLTSLVLARAGSEPCAPTLFGLY